MTDSGDADDRSRWAVSRREGTVWAALAAFAVLSAVLGWGYIFDISSGPVEPLVVTPCWPVIVLFGIVAFLVKHRRRPRADAGAGEEGPHLEEGTGEQAEMDSFFARK
jgi:hypothetical protein